MDILMGLTAVFAIIFGCYLAIYEKDLYIRSLGGMLAICIVIVGLGV